MFTADLNCLRSIIRFVYPLKFITLLKVKITVIYQTHLGTIIPLITLLPMAKLIPAYSPVLITLINGIYDASMAMVSIPVKLYKSGFS
mgnify:CR=1 FL=1